VAFGSEAGEKRKFTRSLIGGEDRWKGLLVIDQGSSKEGRRLELLREGRDG